ncbi:MAG: hypothetical protein MR980_01155 [Bacteroidales bacterium]|nr:hypothetical protein [Bacteroidales bacterium]
MELTTHRTAGRLRVVPLFSLAWRKRRGEDSERRKEDGEDGSGTRGGRERESGRMGDDLERRKEDGEDGNWNRGGRIEEDERGRKRNRRGRNETLRRRKNESEKEETRTLRRRKKGIGNHIIL